MWLVENKRQKFKSEQVFRVSLPVRFAMISSSLMTHWKKIHKHFESLKSLCAYIDLSQTVLPSGQPDWDDTIRTALCFSHFWPDKKGGLQPALSIRQRHHCREQLLVHDNRFHCFCSLSAANLGGAETHAYAHWGCGESRGGGEGGLSLCTLGRQFLFAEESRGSSVI